MVCTAHYKMRNRHAFQIGAAGEFTTKIAMIDTSLYVPTALKRMTRMTLVLTLKTVMIFFVVLKYL